MAVCCIHLNLVAPLTKHINIMIDPLPFLSYYALLSWNPPPHEPPKRLETTKVRNAGPTK
jgi:hypothetical protein